MWFHSPFLGLLATGRLTIVVSEPIKFKHAEINNNITWPNIQLYANQILRAMTMTFIKYLSCNYELTPLFRLVF